MPCQARSGPLPHVFLLAVIVSWEIIRLLGPVLSSFVADSCTDVPWCVHQACEHQTLPIITYEVWVSTVSRLRQLRQKNQFLFKRLRSPTVGAGKRRRHRPLPVWPARNQRTSQNARRRGPAQAGRSNSFGRSGKITCVALVGPHTLQSGEGTMR